MTRIAGRRPPLSVPIGAGLQTLLAVLSVLFAMSRFVYSTVEGIFLLLIGAILLASAVGLLVPGNRRWPYLLSNTVLLSLVVMWFAIMVRGAFVLREAWRMLGLLRLMALPLILILAPLAFLLLPSSRRWFRERRSLDPGWR